MLTPQGHHAAPRVIVANFARGVKYTATDLPSPSIPRGPDLYNVCTKDTDCHVVCDKFLHVLRIFGPLRWNTTHL